MNVLKYVFILLAYTGFLIMFNGTGSSSPIVPFPEFNAVEICIIPLNATQDQCGDNAIPLLDLSTGCGGIVSCLEWIGSLIWNIIAVVIIILLYAILIIVFITQMFIFIITLSAIIATGVDGAPFWVNYIVPTIAILAGTIIAYKLLKSGDSDTD